MKYSRDDLWDMASRWADAARLPKTLKIHTDTTDFFRVDYNDVLILNDRPYLIRNNEKEGRFGIDEQPKFWVKRAIDLMDGSGKIIKFVFRERFRAKVGPLTFDCIRSPAKEARIIDLVSWHDHFMHGFSVTAPNGDIIRVVDVIHGQRFPSYIANIRDDHEEYFHKRFPGILRLFIDTVKAIKFLHDNGELHGDIRRDHLIMDNATQKLRWIDFDFHYSHPENRFGYDLFGLGNVLLFITGKGDVTTNDLRKERPRDYERIGKNDTNIIFRNRVVNLKKLYPYIPEPLNFILLHFSSGAETFYDDTGNFLDDLMEAEKALAV